MRFLFDPEKTIWENDDDDKILRDLDFTFDPENDHYEPKKSVSVFNNNYIQYESIGNKDKTITIKEYLDMIWPYLSDILTDYKTQGEWTIHLTIAINFISSKDSDETCTTHTKSANIEIMMGGETDEIIEELFESLLQERLEESMKGSKFIFDSADVLFHNLNKISLNHGGSHINSPEWLKTKKSNNKS